MPNLPQQVVLPTPTPGESLDAYAPRLIATLQRALTTSLFTLNGLVLVDTAANRPATPPLTGTWFYATDTGALSFGSAGAWVSTFTLAGLTLSDTLSITPPGGTASAIVLFPFGTSAGETSELRFRELVANGSNRVALKAPDSIATNYTVTLPDAAPTVSGQVLSATTAGVSSWYQPRAPIHLWSTGTVAAGTTVYLGNGHDTVQDVHVRVPFACTILAMYTVGPDVNAGGGQSWTYTLRQSATDTAITHAVTGATNVGNSSGSVAVAAGTNIDVKLVTTGSAGVSKHQVMLAVQPT